MLEEGRIKALENAPRGAKRAGVILEPRWRERARFKGFLEHRIVTVW